MKNAANVARRCLKGCLGEWGYRRLRELKCQFSDRRVARLLSRGTPTVFPPALVAALGATPPESDIVDHIGTLFFYALVLDARLIVELGTRGGESTRALLAAVATTGGKLLSVDVNDCAGIGLPDDLKQRWRFVKSDDVKFGREQFAQWCRDEGLAPRIDILFIDTSHSYEHTVQEIDAWQRSVRPGGMMVFHDTNMGEGVFQRRDGSIDYGWDNDRGVIRAIQEFLGREYDENATFVDIAAGWVVSHQPHCNGLTVLWRIPATAGAAP
jgi:predicted O-methyltransferase YrrM